MADLIAQGKCLFYELPFSGPTGAEKSPVAQAKAQEIGTELQGAGSGTTSLPSTSPRWMPTSATAKDPPSSGGVSIRKSLPHLPFEEFVRMVFSRNGGEQQRRRLREIHEKAAASIGCVTHPSVAFEATTLLEGLRQLRSSILETDKKIAEVCRRFPEYPCLLTIPGFGPDIRQRSSGLSAIPTGSRTTGRCSKRQDLIFLPIAAGKELM